MLTSQSVVSVKLMLCLVTMFGVLLRQSPIRKQCSYFFRGAYHPRRIEWQCYLFNRFTHSAGPGLTVHWLIGWWIDWLIGWLMDGYMVPKWFATYPKMGSKIIPTSTQHPLKIHQYPWDQNGGLLAHKGGRPGLTSSFWVDLGVHFGAHFQLKCIQRRFCDSFWACCFTVPVWSWFFIDFDSFFNRFGDLQWGKNWSSSSRRVSGGAWDGGFK